MIKPEDEHKWSLLIILLLLLAWFGALGVMDLRGEEPRRALVAWEMWQRNNWLVPTIQGWPYYNKPPLFNWVLIPLYQLTGLADNWIVRLPSLLAYLIMTFIHYRVTKVWINEAVARWSALFMLTAVHYLFFATVLSGELDLFYALIVYCQAVVIYYYYQQQRWLYLFTASYFLLALGFLTKGVPSVLFQGATFLGLAIYHNHWRWLFSWKHLLGGIIGLLPAISYFIAYHMEQSEGWLYLFNLLEEATQKSAGERSLADIFLHLFEFPVQYFTDHLPWTLILFLLPFKKMKEVINANQWLQFALLFLLSNIWIYWISPGTRQRYLYMFLPFVMVILAAFFEQRQRMIRPQVLIILMLVLSTARIIYNHTLLPHQQQTMKSLQTYREIDQSVKEIADGIEIRTFGIPDTIYVNPSIGPFSLLNDTIYIPQYYPYQIPFEIAKYQKGIIRYDTIAQPGITYLTTDSLLEKGSAHIFYRKEVWDDKTLKVLTFNRAVRPVLIQ